MRSPPSGESVLSLTDLARVAKGLAHPARLAIVGRLADGSELTAGDIVCDSGLAQSTVSQHLRVLRETGIVTARRDGPRVWYRLERHVLREMAVALEALAG